MASSQTSLPAPRSPVGRMAVRRSITVPSKLQTSPGKQAPVEIGAAEGIETLYVHPSAKVVSFTTAPHPISSSRRVSEGDGIGNLPWRTSTERTLAAGFLEIYRVPGSVSFLHSGSLLHAILPRSQCWCVDGVSIFAFRVLPNQYYRIELPGKTEEDLALAEELKITLQKVLHYERTACPFKRGFSVDLPATPPPATRKASRYSVGPAKKWKLDGIWRPEDGSSWTPDGTTEDKATDEAEDREGPSPLTVKHRQCVAAGDEADEEDSDFETPRPQRPSNLGGMRSITAPPKLTLVASPPSKLATIAQLGPSEEEERRDDGENESSHAAQEHVDSHDSPSRTSIGDITEDLRTAQEETLLDERAPLSAVSQMTDQGILSEDDIVESRMWSISTPSLSSDSEDHSWGEVVTPPETLRIRKGRKVPAMETVSRTPSQRLRKPSRESQKALADGLVRKTCTVFLGPPSQLVSMMLKIAAKITHGAFNFTIRSPIGSPHRVPGSWHLADDEDDWDIDDYGFPAGVPGSGQKRASVGETLSVH